MTVIFIQQILQIQNSSIPKDILLGHVLPHSSSLDASHVPSSCDVLSNDEFTIAENYTASLFVIRLTKSQLTAEQVVKVYLTL